MSGSGSGGDPLAGIGSIMQGASSLISTVFGSHSSTSGTTIGSAFQNTAVTDNTDTSASTSSTIANLIHSLTSNSSSTQSFADPGAIAALRSLASTAIGNSTDPSKTSGLISGLLQSAGDSMASIFGTQNTSGLYNGATAGVEKDATLARATADAASAVLGYQTQQQGVAQTALQSILSATGASTTNSTSLVDSNNTTQSATANNSSTRQDVVTNVSAGNDTNTKSKTNSGSSVVCTWMYRNRLLSRERYHLASGELLAMPYYSQQGYFKFAAPLVRELKRDSTSWKSKLIIAIFTARTEFVCARAGKFGCEKKLVGRLALAAVWLGSCGPGLPYLAKHVTNRIFGGQNYAR